jgi:lysozyme family protein
MSKHHEFQEWFNEVLEFEGTTYTDDPADPGGATRYGLILTTYKDYLKKTDRDDNVGKDDIRNMTLDQAAEYYLWLWTSLKLDRIPERLRKGYADACVNMGKGGADRILQMSINTNTNANDIDDWIDVDGQAGRGTMSALAETVLTPFDWLIEHMAYHYNNVFKGSSYTFKQRQRRASKEESDNEKDWFTTRTDKNKFIKGWIKRDVIVFLKSFDQEMTVADLIKNLLR